MPVDGIEEANYVDLASRVATLSAALARGEVVPAGRLLGLPELPEGDVWCDIAGASALSGVPARTITGWLSRGGPKRNPFPRPDRILYRLYWSSNAVREWREQ